MKNENHTLNNIVSFDKLIRKLSNIWDHLANLKSFQGHFRTIKDHYGPLRAILGHLGTIFGFYGSIFWVQDKKMKNGKSHFEKRSNFWQILIFRPFWIMLDLCSLLRPFWTIYCNLELYWSSYGLKYYSLGLNKLMPKLWRLTGLNTLKMEIKVSR